MPQLLFPGEPFAIGIEVAILCYIMAPGRLFTLGGANSELVHAALAGLVYFGWNTYVKEMLQ